MVLPGSKPAEVAGVEKIQSPKRGGIPLETHLASRDAVEGVTIPFASPVLYWKTKQTFREKDQIDRLFLRKLLGDRGEWPVE